MPEMDLPETPTVVSAEALFRYSIVAHVLAAVARGELRAVVVTETADVAHLAIGSGRLRTVSARTLYRWLATFAQAGIGGLEPKPRHRIDASAVLPEVLLVFLQTEKARDKDASIPELIRRARERCIVPADARIHRATVHRALCRMDVPLTRSRGKRDADVRRFAYANRMRMVLVDGKFFRAGPDRTKRVAFFFIDDCTRYVVGVVVGASESAELLLRGLFDVVRRCGLMDILYFDRGSGFVADDTHAVCVRLGVLAINGKARYPEGRGKVERFNRTAWEDCLRALCSPAVDASFGALELRLRHYIDTQYNVRVHEELRGKSPREQWDTDERELRFPRDHQDLRERFFVTEVRTVSADNVISFDGTHYEVPRGHARSPIELRRHTLDGHLEVLHDGRLVRLHPVNLASNAEDRRALIPSPPDDAVEPPVTAAALAFERDFGRVTDSNGGLMFPPTRPITKE